ncbi:MAG: hypothetical protein IH595_01845 [Bacteroidales bacterium]|nr:hypothetical protein [Bacteroidales bacterium]
MESKENKKLAGEMKEGMDLNEILKRVSQGRKTIYISLSVAFVLAIFIVLLTPKKYTTKVMLLSETGSKSGASGLLGQLGSMSGMNLGDLIGINLGNSSGNDVLSPELYPDIVASTPFLLDVMHQTITGSGGGNPVTVSTYLKEHSRPSLIGMITRIFKSSGEGKPFPVLKSGSDEVLHLTKAQTDRLKALSDMIQVNVQKPDDKLMSGGNSKILTVAVEAHDPLVSALLADSVVSCLKRYVVNYNTGKAKKDLEFISEQFLRARQNYYAAQQRLADFMDSHANVILATTTSEKERLEKENNLYASVYTTLAQMKEKAKIQVQDHTPVFTVIEPAKVPLRKSAPRTSLIVLGFLLVGGFIGVAIEVIKLMLNPGRKQ